jgi:hypothetical protein
MPLACEVDHEEPAPPSAAYFSNKRGSKTNNFSSMQQTPNGAKKKSFEALAECSSFDVGSSTTVYIYNQITAHVTSHLRKQYSVRKP